MSTNTHTKPTSSDPDLNQPDHVDYYPDGTPCFMTWDSEPVKTRLLLPDGTTITSYRDRRPYDMPNVQLVSPNGVSIEMWQDETGHPVPREDHGPNYIETFTEFSLDHAPIVAVMREAWLDHQYRLSRDDGPALVEYDTDTGAVKRVVYATGGITYEPTPGKHAAPASATNRPVF